MIRRCDFSGCYAIGPIEVEEDEPGNRSIFACNAHWEIVLAECKAADALS